MKKSLIILLFAVLLLSACQTAKEEAPELLPPVSANVDTEPVKRGDIVGITSYSGALVPESFELYFETDGKIDTISAYTGKYVKEGDLLISLEADQMDRQIDSLEEEIEFAKAERDFEERESALDLQYLEIELKQLTEADPASQAAELKRLDIEEANLKLSQTLENSDLRISEMEERLGKLLTEREMMELHAPVSGYLYLMKGTEEGAQVRKERTIAYLVDDSSFQLVVNDYITALDASRATFSASINGQIFDLTYVPVSAEEIRTKSISGEQIRTTFLINEGQDISSLSAGMYCGVMKTQEMAENVLMVPFKAVHAESGRFYVYVRPEDGSREKRYVTVGANDVMNYEIEEGLEEGEVVYVQD